MRFTIITPVLNMERTIQDALESVACQIDDVAAVQHVVVDGGSDDGTLDVVSRYAHIELVHEATPGIYVAINRGLAVARHEIVGIVNADDLLQSGALRAVAEEFERNPGVDVVAGRAVVERDHRGARRVFRQVPRRGHRARSIGPRRTNSVG